MSDSFGSFREYDASPPPSESRQSRMEIVSVRSGDLEVAVLRDPSGTWWVAEREDGRTVGASRVDRDLGCSYSHDRATWALGGPMPDGARRVTVAGVKGALTAMRGGAWVCAIPNHRSGTELTIYFYDEAGAPVLSRRQYLSRVRRMPFGLGDWLTSKARSIIRPLSR